MSRFLRLVMVVRGEEGMARRRELRGGRSRLRSWRRGRGEWVSASLSGFSSLDFASWATHLVREGVLTVELEYREALTSLGV